MPYDLNGGGGVLSGTIDWSNPSPSAASGGFNWTEAANVFNSIAGGAVNAYTAIRNANTKPPNADAQVTPNDRNPAQDYAIPSGIQVNTGMLMVLALAAVAFFALKK